jgi:hypothetical protein
MSNLKKSMDANRLIKHIFARAGVKLNFKTLLAGVK